MQKKRSIKIISIVLILVLICISITYLKNDSTVVLATTKEFNSENLQNNEHMHVEIDSSGDKVPVPNGYVGSKATGENEIDAGYVIYEGEEVVNDSNVEEAQKTRNQYVWIPVPNASTMYGTDANGKKWGKLYEFTTKTGNNIDPVTGAKPLNWSESDGEMEITSMTSKTSYREPDIVLNYDINSKIKNKEINIKIMHDLLNQLEKEFNSMIESVEKYGGFYIGRYETGNLSKEKVVVIKGNNDISSQNWYSLNKKVQHLKGNNLNIETGMIWGSQWDRTLMWLVESGNITKEDIINSINWGNYRDSSFEYIDEYNSIKNKVEGLAIKIPTGNAKYTKVNNIYDLAGNVAEWTMEASGSGARSGRGGWIGGASRNFYAAYRYGSLPDDSINSNKRLSSNVIHKIGKICTLRAYVRMIKSLNQKTPCNLINNKNKRSNIIRLKRGNRYNVSISSFTYKKSKTAFP